MSFFSFFLDPLYQSSFIGSIFMCFATALIGVIVFLQKRSLLGEVLSHAAYPGIALFILFFQFIDLSQDGISAIVIFMGALTCALLGLRFIYFLEEKIGLYPDSALCYTLSSFLGIGVLATSLLQHFSPSSVYKIQLFLYGQVVTITSIYMWLYLALLLAVSFILYLRYFSWKMVLFDGQYSRFMGVRVSLEQRIMNGIILIVIIMGIRLAGVILISGMLIAPALAARQVTGKLSHFLFVAGVIGSVSGFLGNVLSLYLPHWFHLPAQFYLPTGPCIVFIAGLIAFIAILFAPRRGKVARWVRKIRFQYRRNYENTLKTIWKCKEHSMKKETASLWMMKPLMKNLLISHLAMKGLLKKKNKIYTLTPKGALEAERIIRLHRLWEVYLFDYLKYSQQNVHESAEEMEHFLTPELEEELTKLLNNPAYDPHNQPIPKGGNSA